jgi:anti-anti-sigma regulatory factor
MGMTNETPSVVRLSGAIDVRSIGEAFDQISEAARHAARSGKDLECDLTEVTDIDLTCLQLIEAARRSMREAGTALRLSAPARDTVLETLQRAGFLCEPPDDRTRFWMAASGQAV